MLLRASDQEHAGTLDLRAIVEGADTDSGVPAGSALLRFVDAALGDEPQLASARTAVEQSIGREGAMDAAAVIGNFQRMVRIADSTGIVLDRMMADSTRDIRAQLQLDSFTSRRLPR